MNPIDPGALEDWARRATPGSSIALGRGERLPRALSAAVTQLADRGILAPVSKRVSRNGGGNEFLFMAQRGSISFDRARAMDLRARSRGRVRVARPARSTGETAILKMIKRAIARRQPCPTNEEFARGAGLAGRVSASDRLKQLVRRGLISIEDHSPFGRRVVTLLATGESTVAAPI